MPGVWMSPFCAVFGGGVPGKGWVSSSDNVKNLMRYVRVYYKNESIIISKM